MAAANFFGAAFATGSNENQLAIYSSSTRCRLMISRLFAITFFQFLIRNGNAFNDVCSHRMQHAITTKSRSVIARKLCR